MKTTTLVMPSESSPVRAAIRDLETALNALDAFDGEADSVACKILCDAYSQAKAQLDVAMASGYTKDDAAAFGDFVLRRLIADGHDPNGEATTALRITVDALYS